MSERYVTITFVVIDTDPEHSEYTDVTDIGADIVTRFNQHKYDYGRWEDGDPVFQLGYVAGMEFKR